MIEFSRRASVVGLVGASLMLGACGSSGATGGQGQAQSAVPDPCTLITDAEAAAALNVRATHGASGQSGDAKVCEWPDPDRRHSIRFTILPGTLSVSDFTSSAESDGFTQAPKLPGADSARYGTDGLRVLKSGNSLQFTFTGRRAQGSILDVQLGAEEDLAQTSLRRWPGAGSVASLFASPVYRDPCSILTDDEAATALGAPVHGTANPSRPWECDWTIERQSNEILVSYLGPVDFANFQTAFHNQMTSVVGTSPEPGIGAAAYLQKTRAAAMSGGSLENAIVTFIKGGRAVEVVFAHWSQGEAQPNGARDLAHVVAART